MYGKDSLSLHHFSPYGVGIFPNERRKPRTRKQYPGCLCWKMHDGESRLNPAGRETNGRVFARYASTRVTKPPSTLFFSFFFFFLFPFFVRGETDSSASPSVLFLPPFISLSFFLSLSPATIIRFHRFCISSVSLIILFRFDFFITEITCEGHGTCCRSFLNR